MYHACTPRNCENDTTLSCLHSNSVFTLFHFLIKCVYMCVYTHTHTLGTHIHVHVVFLRGTSKNNFYWSGSVKLKCNSQKDQPQPHNLNHNHSHLPFVFGCVARLRHATLHIVYTPLLSTHGIQGGTQCYATPGQYWSHPKNGQPDRDFAKLSHL